MKILALGLLALAAASCTGTPSTDFRVTFMTQETFTARPESQEVEVVSGKPERPHVSIAYLQGWDAAHGADGQRLMAAMRKKTRELGGDAIAEFQLLQNGQTRTVNVPVTTGNASGTWMTRDGAVNAFGVVVRWKE